MSNKIKILSTVLIIPLTIANMSEAHAIGLNPANQGSQNSLCKAVENERDMCLADLSDAEADLTMCEADLSDAQTDLADTQAELDMCTQDLSAANQKIADLEAQVQEQNDQNISLIDELDMLINENQQLDQELAGERTVALYKGAFYCLQRLSKRDKRNRIRDARSKTKTDRILAKCVKNLEKFANAALESKLDAEILLTNQRKRK